MPKIIIAATFTTIAGAIYQVGMVGYSKPAYRPDIDGLRAIAIVMVVGYHAGVPGFASGFLGVDVFFVISGFVIGRVLFTELRERGSVDVWAFIARRVRRLLPASLVMSLCVLVAATALLLPFGDLQKALKSLVAANLYSANLYFAWGAWDYFDAVVGSAPLLHMWTLSLEEQFYLVIVAALWALSGVVQKREGAMVTAVAWLLSAIGLASLLGGALWWGTGQRSFFLLPARMFEFVPGLLVALFESRLTHAGWRHAAPLALVALCAGAALPIGGDYAWLTWTILPVVATTLLVLPGSSIGATGVARFLSSPVLIWVGRRSFGWYLWHWPLLSLSRYYFLGDSGLLRDVTIAGSALVLAHVSLLYVEDPFRRTVAVGLSPKRAIALGCAASFAVIVSALAVALYAKWFLVNADAYQEVRKAQEEVAHLTSPCFGWGVFAKLPAQSECRFGDETSRTTVVVWGDSHAAALVAGLDGELSRRGVAGLQRTWASCPGVRGFSTALNVRPETRENCIKHNGQVFEEILTLARERPVSVLLAARWIPHLGRQALVLNQQAAFTRFLKGVSRPSALSALEVPLEAMLDQLRAEGVRVLIVAQPPELPFPAARCVQRGWGDRCAADRELTNEYRSDMEELFARLSSSHANVAVFDPVETLCDASLCRPVQQGTVLYLDADHINGAGARLLVSAMPHALDWMTASEAQ